MLALIIMKNFIILISFFCYAYSAFIMSNYTIEKFKRFKQMLRKSKNILVITGAGISTSENMPTFESIHKFWKYPNPRVFNDSPCLVWEYYHFKRNFVMRMTPNKAFYDLAEFEERCRTEGRKFTIITQNIDELHQKAGSRNVVELHGSLFQTKCTVCGDVLPNHDLYICPSLKGRKGQDEIGKENKTIAYSELPRCKKSGCNGLLRPNVVGFSETLESHIYKKIEDTLENCDICLVIGTSPMVSLAVELGSKILQNNLPVAAFNIISTSSNPLFQFYFSGPVTKIVEEALSET